MRGDRGRAGCLHNGFAGWAGSGSGSVTSSAARIRPGRELSEEGVGIDQLAPGHVDQQGLVRKHREFPGPDQLVSLGGVRRDEKGDVGPRQQPVQIVDRMNLRGGPRRACRATRVMEATSKPCSRHSIAWPMCLFPDDPPGRAGPPVTGPKIGTPGTGALGLGRAVQVPSAGQGQGHREFGGTGVMQAGGVAQHGRGRRPRRGELILARR